MSSPGAPDSRAGLEPGAPRTFRERTGRLWLPLALLAAFLPVCGVLFPSRVFYIRDLSLFFWGRHLFLRRSLFSGEFPLWDPHIAGGQSVAADALNQVFLLPVVALRMLGSEVMGFNLWVAMPFPLAALGAYLFFRTRFSARAAALGAVVFAVSGPVISTGNTPNLSWSVAAMPWVFWGISRCLALESWRACGVLALMTAFQALAGEPVTMTATVGAGLLYAVFHAGEDGNRSWRRSGRPVGFTVLGLALGGLLAAVQLVPLALAVRESWRPFAVGRYFWSLHPLALLETIYLHLFGNYFEANSLARVPWMPVLFSGREPLFHSIYLGVATLTLALFGVLAGRHRRWTWFWLVSAAGALFLSFGNYSPVYPLIRTLVPLLTSFRFPVKYLLLAALALAALVASAWDAMERSRDAVPESDRRERLARRLTVAFPIVIGAAAWLVSAACIYATTGTAFRIYNVARSLGIIDPVSATEFMLRALREGATVVVLLSALTALLAGLATSRRREAGLAAAAFYAFIVIDLVVHAWPINPTFDAAYFAEPAWVSAVQADSDSTFYLGGKLDGTLDPADPDSSRGFTNAPGLKGSASRSALSAQAVFYPSGYGVREFFAYDLAVLWPRPFHLLHQRFLKAPRDQRLRFLENNGVRYRLVSATVAPERRPLVQVPYFTDLFLYDWGPVAARADIRSTARVQPDILRQIEESFVPGLSDGETVMLERELPIEGTPGHAVTPFARIAIRRANRLVVECGLDTRGGYLLVLDSYSPDWRVTVDGRPATTGRANVLFRAVHLAPGEHRVEFTYRPAGFLWGAGLTVLGGVVCLALLWRRPARA